MPHAGAPPSNFGLIQMEDARGLWLQIGFGVPNTSASAHHLNVAGDDASLIPQAVAMAHRTVADIGDDFHIGVGMRRETAVRRDLVVVPDAQRPPPDAACAGEK